MAPASGTVSIEPGSAEGRHFLIIESREHEAVADDLLRGATAALQQAGATWDVVSTPGVFEIPAAIAVALDTQPEDYDGFVALGGNSASDPLILEQSTRALMDLSITEALALGYGLFALDQQGSGEERGGAAARAALSMAALRARLEV